MKNKSIKYFIATFMLLFHTTSYASIPAMSNELHSLAPIIKNSTPAIVNISIIPKKQNSSNPLFNDPFFHNFFKDFPFNDEDQLKFKNNDKLTKQQSIGSGVIIDANKGHIVTNYHVIKNAKEVFVTLKDKRQIKAEIIGSDKATDIALLKINEQNITALPISDSDKLEVGDFVVAIGHPFSLNHTVTSGIVSGLGRSGLGIDGYENFIQTDASINPGNSGGALINLRGELVGINTFIISGGNGGNIGIGFAIPSNIVKMVTQNLTKYGKVKRGQIGIYTQNITPDLAKAFDLSINSGAIITKVNKNSPAEKAGLKEGDVITEVDGKKVNNISDVRNIVGMHTINESVQVNLIRNQKSKSIKVRVGPELTEDSNVSDIKLELLNGAKFAEMTNSHPLYEKVKGVVVTMVEKNSSAWNSGLREKDIIVSANKQKVSNIAEFKKALSKKENGILLNIRRKNAALYIIIH